MQLALQSHTLPVFIKRLVKLYDEQYGESSEEEEVAQAPAPSQGHMQEQFAQAVHTFVCQDLVIGWRQPCSMHWARRGKHTSV